MSVFSELLHDRLRPVRMGGQVNGALVVERDSDEDSSSDSESDTEQQEFVKKELASYAIEPTNLGGLTYINEGHEESYLGSELGGLCQVPRAFAAYKFDTYHQKQLPIDSYRLKILELIKSNSIVIVQGPTGCGKTTQVPQYILDECKNNNTTCNIVVTQPRRIAAINIAQRVCEERGWALGTVVGYQVGLDKNSGDSVVLTYMTTEVLLQKLIMKKNLNEFTHIIIDEVHERTKSLDFLLLVARKYLCTNSPSVKLILMSATMDAQKFAHYFRTKPRSANSDDLYAPITNITKPSEFSFDVYYTDHIIRGTGWKNPEFNIDEPKIYPEQYDLCIHLIQYFINIDKVESTAEVPELGSVLVFLPGFFEIEEMDNRLRKKKFDPIEVDVIPLHSSLTHEQMAKAFQPSKKGVRKIILSTNIAESSVTVPDVTYVIDFCLTKVMTVNPMTKFSALRLEWASHNNCKQRAGRVGRVSNGRVYRLVTNFFYDNEMLEVSEPEMQRAPLENIILYMKMLDLQDTPKNILSLAISPPNLKDVDTCVWHLKEIGALYKFCRGSESTSDGDITFLGRIMSLLPIDIHLAKLVFLGHMFSCLEESVIMAAGASTRNLFMNSFRDRLQCYRKKLLWADGSGSDFISLLNLYNVWRNAKRDGSFKSHADEYTWCSLNSVYYKGLKEWEYLIKDIHERLGRLKIEKSTNENGVRLTAREKPIVFKVIICGAFYPNYFLRSNEFGRIDSEQSVKTVNGRDPRNTVYLTNMKLNQPGQIYVRQIKKAVGCGSNAQISFDLQSSKVFIEYDNENHPQQVRVDGVEMLAPIPGGIPMEVYEAVRRRQLKHNVVLQLLPEDKAWDFAHRFEIQHALPKETKEFPTLEFNPIPTLDMNYMQVKISHIETISHFYCHSFNEETGTVLDAVYRALNDPGIVLELAEKVEIGEVYATLYEADAKFYRCKVLHSVPRQPPSVQVQFIDYGNIQLVQTNRLYNLPEAEVCKVKPVAICCSLSEVRPSIVLSPKALWTETANESFRQKTANIVMNGHIYSVVNDVVHLELYMENTQQSFNDWLVAKNHAEKCEEHYLSRADHELRLQVQKSENPVNEACQSTLIASSKRYVDFAAPELSDDRTEIVELKGPFSSLEMRVCGLMRAASNVQVSIESDSVNTVLLDTDPDDPHARLLVAGQASQSATTNVLRISQTTLMPSIPGFPMLMVLLFCPEMEPKPTEDGTRIASILAGVGASRKDRKPYYPMHDILLNLDTQLTQEILNKVDELRFSMNEIVTLMSNIAYDISYPTEMGVFHRDLKRQLFDLLHLRQRPMEPTIAKYATVWGKSACEDLEVLMACESHESDIWPMLWFLNLTDGRSVTIIEDNLKELSSISKKLIPAKPIICELCEKFPMQTLADVRIHLFKADHQKKLKEFRSSRNSSNSGSK